MGAMRYARWTASRWNVSWYCNEARDVKPAMEAARKGRAKKMRRSTPIFHTVRQASPSEGAGSTTASTSTSSPTDTGSPRSDASICSDSSTCS